ncbi:MAG: hypothetical protein WBP82_02850 [Leuconostoc mesenteroides]
MRPVSPVIIKELPKEVTAVEVLVAKNQEEYRNLPAIFLKNGDVCPSKWEITDEEFETLKETKSIFVYQCNFQRKIAPMLLSVRADENIEIS